MVNTEKAPLGSVNKVCLVNVKFWLGRQYLKPEKGWFITPPFIFRSRENRSQKKTMLICDKLFDITGVYATSSFSFCAKNRDETKKLLSGVFSGFVSFRRIYSEDKYRRKWRLLCDNCPVIFSHATYPNSS